MAHYIDESVECVLKSLTGIAEQDPLPKSVEKTYWRFKKMADKIGSPMTPSDLIYAVLDSGHQLPGDRERGFLDDVDESLIKWGEPVKVKWRGGKWVDGFYHGMRSKEEAVVLLADETGEERTVHPDRVRLPLADEVGVVVETEAEAV